MDHVIFIHYLESVDRIISEHKKISDITGEKFNIFQILGLSSEETRTHSAFLSELLNPKGSHGQRNNFLKLFLKQIQIESFESESARVETEKYIGKIDHDYTKGGSIDILITDERNQRIIIENKIYAQDQKHQLLRYHNYDPTAKLLYLNLLGDEPTPVSTGDQLKKGDYKVISYRDDIINWLIDCRKECVQLPILRETISQYIYLVKMLTGQEVKNQMNQEIRNFMIQHPEFLETIAICTSELKSIIDETNTEFFSRLNSRFPKGALVRFNGISIVATVSEDSDGVFMAYSAMKDNVNVSSDQTTTFLRDILQEINKDFHTGGNWLGWINPSPFNRYERFRDLSISEIEKLYSDKNSLESFVQKILDFESDIRKRFIEKISQVVELEK